MSYHPISYKVVFMSSALIGVPFLQALADDKRFDIVGVVTMPDVPFGRGGHMQSNIIKTEAVRIFSDQNHM
jgi:methionyl-tRNA formyltransferase